MSAPSGTTTTLVSIGNREDLENTIYRVAPEETPFMSMIDRVPAKAVTHEWQTEGLNAASATAQALEGNDAGTLTTNLTTRIGNLCQINKKEYGVSGTQETVSSAGRASDMARMRVLMGIEARRDAELRFMGNYATVAESGATARKSGGAQAACVTNSVYGSGGSGTAISGSTWVATTAGTNRTNTESLLKTVLATAFGNGGKPSVAFMSGTQKQQVSAFTGIASIRMDASGNKQATIMGAADVYMSDFGKISFVPHAYGIANAMLLIDPSKWAIGVLRGWRTEQLAKTGDSEREHILAEHTLVARNEKSSACIFALT